MIWQELKDWLVSVLPFGDEMTASLIMMVASIVLTYFGAKFLIWLINNKILSRFFRRKNVDLGRQYALRHVISYLIWALAVFTILEILGISNIILASSAALMVGIGLGLQDTFKDLICGIVILVEGTVKVGDFIEMDGKAGEVKKIGLRVSTVNTRDNIHVLIPNSKLVIDKVTNWSHETGPSRFSIQVGVAYGTDMQLAQSLLLQAAERHNKVLKEPKAQVQFKSFGDSSLNLELYFFSKEYFKIELVKSELRFQIDELFRENSIQIPFPQRDLWIKNPGDFKS